MNDDALYKVAVYTSTEMRTYTIMIRELKGSVLKEEFCYYLSIQSQGM